MSGLRTKPTNAAAVSRVLGREVSKNLFKTEDRGDGVVIVQVDGRYFRQAMSTLARAWYDFETSDRGFLVKGKIQG